mmetsp:Transcript_12339/g.18407  ORF Transcript_12339/g.18407 Transcript_12339/m.18407 type:complete len:280 (+) Transcript_12339:2-841(+)
MAQGMGGNKIKVSLAFVFVCLASGIYIKEKDVPRLLIAPSDDSKFSVNETIFPEMGGAKKRDGILLRFSGAAPHFNAVPPIDGCGKGLFTTSDTSKVNKCKYATNGGPFTMKEPGACHGVLVENGIVLENNYDVGVNAQFGVTNKSEWILGRLNDTAEVRSLGVKHALSGFGWLVYNSTNVVPKDGGKIAPRTAIGVDKDGKLLLFTIDGCELCVNGKGVTLFQLAEILIHKADAVHAINLDGGGSTTLVKNGDVQNRPTCNDIPIICERKVATIVCLK